MSARFLDAIKNTDSGVERQALLDAVMNDNKPLSVKVRKELTKGDAVQREMNELRTRFIKIKEAYEKKMEMLRKRALNETAWKIEVSDTKPEFGVIDGSLDHYVVPNKFLVRMCKLAMDGKVEYGGHLRHGADGVVREIQEVAGTMKSISVPIENGIHWHTHPFCLVGSDAIDINGFRQVPSSHDVAVVANKSVLLDGKHNVNLVATHEGIYVCRANVKKLTELGIVDDDTFRSEFLKMEIIGKYTLYRGFMQRLGKLNADVHSTAYDLMFEAAKKEIVVEDVMAPRGSQNELIDEMYVAMKPPYSKEIYDTVDRVERVYLDACAEYGVDIEFVKWDAIKDGSLKLNLHRY